ncbi:TatD DNase family protein [Metamycoplasma subdolum]|uniref:TatD DNase family protein n=1 Tax=Metamycoplasma subdolum TaxID=92407 RepID=A0A3M0A2Z9_9BACT|nr:TatD family hydrolase [Metamycoplasma subdolum]RMA79017.1 TatD DNase family protein [Metamycoplasma subdolum]WPB50540.1 TatD family hydrolase [Metamycoplasma subdolum]
MKFIDAHTHPFREYYESPYKVSQDWLSQDMEKLFAVGTCRGDSVEVIELAKKDPERIHPVIGIHPTEATGKQDGEFLERIITKDVVAIGEFGLDYHYDDSPSKEIQKESFISQLKVAQKHKIVAMLHLRDSLEDAYEIFSKPEYRDVKFVLHSFSGDVEYARKCLKLPNVYFSISGVITFKNATELNEAVSILPVDRITCETDTPYLAPVPMRGKPNISPYVRYVYEHIAKMKNMPLEDFVKQIRKNIKTIYGV